MGYNIGYYILLVLKIFYFMLQKYNTVFWNILVLERNYINYNIEKPINLQREQILLKIRNLPNYFYMNGFVNWLKLMI